MKKSKWAQEQEARIRHQAGEKARQKRTKKAEIEGGQGPTKPQVGAKVPKSGKAGKRPALTDYEPLERPLSTFNARHAFLSKIIELAPAKVDALFDSCLKSFLKLTRRSRTAFARGDDALTMAESNPLDWLELDEGELKQILDMNPEFDGLPELQDRLTEEREFCERLTAWGFDCGMEEKWFLEFGWQTLLHYWQETRPKILKAMPPPVAKSPRRNLPIDPPGRVTVNVAEQRRARAVAAVLGDAARIVPAVQARPAVDTVEIIQKRRRRAWLDALLYLMGDRDVRMTAPEHKWSNKYEVVGFFRSIEKPKYLQLQPPQPPEGLPPIADPFFTYVMTRKQYKQTVRRQLYAQLGSGPAQLVPEEVREKWRREAFSHLTPYIDTYWREYGAYLREQGWIEVKSKKELQRDAGLAVRAIVCSHLYEDIALEEWKKETGVTTRKPTPVERRDEIKGRIEKRIRMAVGGFVELAGLPRKYAYQSIEEDMDTMRQR